MSITASESGKNTEQPPKEKNIFSPPAIALPKGGGAIRGIGEKFAANPVTGTGAITVPLATSPGRSGFGPQLTLSYDSSAGNGLFGFGWSLSLPAITRKTDKGLPQYRNVDESDVFILSGHEDLVPVLKKNEEGNWIHDEHTKVEGYLIRVYRPRIEGLFARIERWTELSSGNVHWRSLTKDNILTLYGKDSNSRIVDPDEQTHIFSWLISESRDDKGNVIFYQYKEEDSTDVSLSQIHELNRGDKLSSLRRTNRYIKHIYYGNQQPLLDENSGQRPHFLNPSRLAETQWMFEVVFDYGEHALKNPTPNDKGEWLCRHDPFSSYRAGFEVRTYRLCQRVLMFHHFPNEENVRENCLVRSTDFVYRNVRNNPDDSTHGHPIASFIASVTQNGYKRTDNDDNKYLKKSFPALEFEYSEAIIHEKIESIDAESVENLPIGIDEKQYRWLDLFGEGISGIFIDQEDGWFYKHNLSTAVKKDLSTPGKQPEKQIHFAPMKCVSQKPKVSIGAGSAQFMDLAGDGQLDVVMFDNPTPGFFENIEDETWMPFQAFKSRFNYSSNDPNLKFIDLNGDGHADALITEDQVLTWFPSLGEEGFGEPRQIARSIDEEKGPAIVFADQTQSIYLADMSGDGLTDIVRIRNGEVCYWPNLGYGRFGTKITMNNSPWFDTPDNFEQRRIRVADIDGSGNTDIIYLTAEGVHLYFNQSGNSWSDPHKLNNFPKIDNLSTVDVSDLFGNGTACLVWSSVLPNSLGQIFYINLMGKNKPHLLIKSKNNLGAETEIQYAPSTKFYLQDKLDEKPWITRLPFPVHVVERIITYDRISHNHFVTRYAYHHGYFDGVEREFRGFGMVEQWDTEEFMRLNTEDMLPASNIDQATYLPSVYTKTWFHTGCYFGKQRISRQFESEYFRESKRRNEKLNDEEFKYLLLEDTILPTTIEMPDNQSQNYLLNSEEIREACRSLKGLLLHQETYALDRSDYASIPYIVLENNYTIKLLQPKMSNSHAIFFTHPRENLQYHYERTLFNVDSRNKIVDVNNVSVEERSNIFKLVDPRVSHALTLGVDCYGNILQSVSIVYPRRYQDMQLNEYYPDITDKIWKKQNKLSIIYSENSPTNVISDNDNYRTPLIWETKTYEILHQPLVQLTGQFLTPFFQYQEIVDLIAEVTPHPDPDNTENIISRDIPYNDFDGITFPDDKPCRRLIEHLSTLYRSDDLTTTLSPGMLQSRSLPYESYKLAFNVDILGSYENKVDSELLTLAGYCLLNDSAVNWWIPSGKIYYSPVDLSSFSEELSYAEQHFFLPHRFEDPWGHTSQITYDSYSLLPQESIDALGNRITAGERDKIDNTLCRQGNDYRVLQSTFMMDPNRNCTEIAFDALGLVVGTAVLGKPENPEGDSLEDFNQDLSDIAIASILDNLSQNTDAYFDPNRILQKATTRIVYDFAAFSRTVDSGSPEPCMVYTISRDTHSSVGSSTQYHHNITFCDGFGREIQKKIKVEPGPLTDLIEDTSIEDGSTVKPRWLVSGWVIFNNKGKPVKQYEPFYSAIPYFKFKIQGFSSTLFYDPIGRVIIILRPNHTYEKVVFDPWQQLTYDVNDTILLDPRNDSDTEHFVKFYFQSETSEWKTWAQERLSDFEHLGFEDFPNIDEERPEEAAAIKTLKHAGTPTISYFNPLGKAFLTLTHNGYDTESKPILYATTIELDIEGNQQFISDAYERKIMQYEYDMLSNKIKQISMDAGTRWLFNDVLGKPIRLWDNRNHTFLWEYDELQRPTIKKVLGGDGDFPLNHVYEKIIYGEEQTYQNKKDVELNLRTKPFILFDTAGKILFEKYDFKNNIQIGHRQLAKDYKSIVNWDDTDLEIKLESEIYSSVTEYNANNKIISLENQLSSVFSDKIDHFYNEYGLLQRVEVTESQQTDIFVKNIIYNEKSQRKKIEYGNGIITKYTYDQKTFLLTNLKSYKSINNPLQDLYYTYDPIGNITQVEDQARPTIFFGNMETRPVNAFYYDPLYRLTAANGREHIATVIHGIEDNWNDSPFLRQYSVNDPLAWRNYTETYQYDPVGNINKIEHFAAGGDWIRTYQYAEASNRLQSTKINNETSSYSYLHHEMHGFMTKMPHLQFMRWNFKDELIATSKQSRNNGTPEITYYVYDGTGKRIRKITEKSVRDTDIPTIKCERIYIGNKEIYREYSGSNTDNVGLERSSVNIMDDKQRIALIETRNQVDDGTAPRLVRYQFSNHLGTTSLETDHTGRVISYEEYHPYGTTSYQAIDKDIRAAYKRYRYTGKERDEESGFYYHGARYYAPWLGRWVSCDPAGLVDGNNLYFSFRNSPICLIDPSGFNSIDPAGTGYARYAITINIDEPAAVGEKGISSTEAMRRAMDLGERTFLDPMTNQATKGSRVFRPPYKGWTPPKLKPTSLRDDPSAIWRPKLGGIEEWDQLSQEILKDVSSRLNGKTPLEVKDILNSELRSKIKNPNSIASKFVSETLSKELGIKPENLFATEKIDALKWDSRSSLASGVTKASSVGSKVLGLSGITSLVVDFLNFSRERGVNESGYSSYAYTGMAILEDASGEYKIEHKLKTYISGSKKGESAELGFFEILRETQKRNEKYGYFNWKGEFVPGKVPPIVVSPEQQRIQYYTQ